MQPMSLLKMTRAKWWVIPKEAESLPVLCALPCRVGVVENGTRAAHYFSHYIPLDER